MIYILYHNDLDGYCSAHLVIRNTAGAKQLIEVTYDDEIDIDDFLPNSKVYIVDFHIDPVKMLELQDKCEVVWIDHHKTAIEKYKDYPHDIEGIRRDGTAACELVFEYFKADQEKPLYVCLIGDWDVWNFKYGDNARYFHYGMLLEATSPTSSVWDELADLEEQFYKSKNTIYSYKQICETGKTSFKTLMNYYNGVIKDKGFKTTFEGHKAIICNLPRCNSEAFSKYKEPLKIAFAKGEDKFTVSLYSEEIDVSEIAKKYGGGGHTGAAGFVCKELPF